MPTNRRTQRSGTTRRRIEIPDGYTTTDATTTTAFSISVSTNRVFYIQVRFLYNISDYSAAGLMVLEGTFRRASGNIVRASQNSGIIPPIIKSSGDFTGQQPSCDLVANTSTNAIDIKITGKASTTINWQFEIITIRNI